MSGRDQIQIELPADLKYLNVLGGVCKSLFERIPDLEEPDVLAYHFDLALQEIATNIVRHAYDGVTNGRIKVDFMLDSSKKLTIRFCDNGRSFAIEDIPDPNLEDSQVHGYGLFLVKHIMDTVTYETAVNENIWLLTKQL